VSSVASWGGKADRLRLGGMKELGTSVMVHAVLDLRGGRASKKDPGLVEVKLGYREKFFTGKTKMGWCKGGARLCLLQSNARQRGPQIKYVRGNLGGEKDRKSSDRTASRKNLSFLGRLGA